MRLVFPILSALTVAFAVGAMTFRNLVHCALCLAGAFGGIALLYLQLNAEFIGFAQILVYVGAVTILIVFAMLLTRNISGVHELRALGNWISGIGVALLTTGALVFAAVNSSIAQNAPPATAALPARALGERLMSQYVLPLEVLGLLLTAAMLGAVVIALKEPGESPGPTENRAEPTKP